MCALNLSLGALVKRFILSSAVIPMGKPRFQAGLFFSPSLDVEASSDPRVLLVSDNAMVTRKPYFDQSGDKGPRSAV